MTSPVDTSVKHYSSLMSGAPVINGTAGSLIAAIKACLKDGFDIKSVGITVAGGVATIAWSGTHSNDVDTVVLVAGVTGGPTNWANLNGEQKIVSKAAGGGSSTFACPGVADGTATGTITIKMAPVGLVEVFSGANTSALKFSDVQGTGMMLRIDDSATTFARVVGYESMSDINTGLGPFPAPAQMSGGGYWPKSTIANSAPVQWALFADSRSMILHIAAGYSSNAGFTAGVTRFFGDGIPAKPSGDPYFCLLNYSSTPTPSSMVDGALDSNANTVVFQHAAPRSYTGLGVAYYSASLPYVGTSNAYSGFDTQLGVAPSQIDGGIRLSKRYICTAVAGANPRGDAPGIYSIPQSSAFDFLKFGAKYAGTGVYAGKKFFVVNPTNSMATTPNNANSGAALVDVTGPWR